MKNMTRNAYEFSSALDFLASKKKPFKVESSLTGRMVIETEKSLGEELETRLKEIRRKKLWVLAYQKTARQNNHEEGRLEIDNNATVSFSSDLNRGAYVEAWVWVESDEVKNSLQGAKA